MLLVAALLALLLAPSPGRPRADPPLAQVRTFALALGDGQLRAGAADRLGRYDLVVIDGEEASPKLIDALRAKGTIVLAYLSVGTIENYRDWYARAKPYRLDLWGDWGEFYADVSESGFRDLIAGDVAPAMRSKGFDGLFLDNTDMIESHPRQAAGMRELVARLDVPGSLLFTQNGEGSIGPSLSHYDGWNREDVTSTYDFDRRRYVRVRGDDAKAARAALRRIRAAGLFTTATDYTLDAPTTAMAAKNVCGAGAVPFVADIGLRKLPPKPLRC